VLGRSMFWVEQGRAGVVDACQGQRHAGLPVRARPVSVRLPRPPCAGLILVHHVYKCVGLARTIHTYVCTVHIRYFKQGNHHTYGHIRCAYTVLANPRNVQ